MPLHTLPLIAWGSAEDISAYTTGAGTPTVTSGQADPFGGTGAYKIDDNDAGTAESKYKAVTFTANGTQYLATWAKADTATVSHAAVWDNTASAFRAVLGLTWSGGVPTSAIASGSGTVYGTISVGASWYLILWSADNVVAANTNRFHLYGATTTASSTGATIYYMRNVVALDYLDSAVASSMLRAGSQVGQTLSGVEDAFVTGRDYLLNAAAVWVSLTPSTTPVVSSGWAGPNESTGINAGIGAMLHNGMSRNALTFVPDRSACSTSVSCYLQRPESDTEIGLLPGGYRTFGLRLRSASEFTGI
jgi:hypothetical protein